MRGEPLRVPVAGPAVPRFGNALTRLVARGVMRVLGWRFRGELPEVSKCVAIVAPHTSGWDFVVGMAAMLALGIRVHYLGKHTLFRGPLGAFVRWSGGIPVDRRQPGDIIERVAAMFAARQRLWVGLAPEGTRRRVERWKSGFHRLAVAAGVSVWPVCFDYRNRIVGLLPLYQPTGRLEEDLAALQALYVPEMARHPEAYGIEIREAERGA